MRVLKAFAAATALLTSNVISLPHIHSSVDSPARDLIASRSAPNDALEVVQSAITTFEETVISNHAEIGTLNLNKAIIH